ncbi:UNVERIFIED_CONTAM: hypothetical protein FKN15_030249 [Acipenser sinensis]
MQHCASRPCLKLCVSGLPYVKIFFRDQGSFAENTMNELLGWYGYDKVELKDGEDIEINNYPDGESRQHISVLKENLPKPKPSEDRGSSPTNANSSYSGATMGNGMAESSSSSSSSSSSGLKDHGKVPIIVPLIPLPHIKPPAGIAGCSLCFHAGSTAAAPHHTAPSLTQESLAAHSASTLDPLLPLLTTPLRL